VELWLKSKAASSSEFGSAQHAVLNAGNPNSSAEGKANNNDKIFNLTLQAIRVVHVRRTVSKVRNADPSGVFHDNYKLLLEKMPKTHFRRPFIMLDRLNAMLAAAYEVRERISSKSVAPDTKAIEKMENEALRLAREYLEFFDKAASMGNRDTTLFVASTQSLSNELFEETKLHFARAVSLYHSLDLHKLCAEWSDLLQRILQLRRQGSISLEDADVLLGQVMTVKAYALSMSGNHASGVSKSRVLPIETLDALYVF